MLSARQVLILSITCWNAAFFGNSYTAFLIFPAMFFFALSLFKFKDKKEALLHGFVWGIFCLGSQMWWLPRIGIVYSDQFNPFAVFGGFLLFLVLFGTTHAFFTYCASSALKYIKIKILKPIAATLLLWLYFFYLAHYSFTPLGHIQGYPFFWPFLPLANSELFMNSLKKICEKQMSKTLKEKLKKIDFVALDSNLLEPFDQENKSLSVVGKKIYEALHRHPKGVYSRVTTRDYGQTSSPSSNKSPNSLCCIRRSLGEGGCSNKPTTVYLAPESTFPFPINESHLGFTELWGSKLSDNEHFLFGTQTKNEDGVCQAVAWINNGKVKKCIEKKYLCPLVETREFVQSKNRETEFLEIEGLKLVPIICFDFFQDLSLLGKINPENELAVLFLNNVWGPEQTRRMTLSAASLASIWHNRKLLIVKN